jgi:hypothetical protein
MTLPFSRKLKHWTACLSVSVIVLVATVLMGSPMPAAAQYYGFSDRPFYRHSDNYYPSGMPTFRHFNFPSKRRRVAQPRSESLPKEPFGKIQTGPIQIVISLNRQQLSLYSDGVLVTRSPISTGVRQHPTPTGVFSVIQKQLFHRSNIYSDAPMPYMQRITWSGIAIHEGVVPGHPASHGCIRLPRAFAVRLYSLTRIGARVIVARDEVAPLEIEHPHLFVAKRSVLETAAATNTLAPTLPLTQVATIPETTAPSSGTVGNVDGLAKLDEKSHPGRPISVFVSRKEGMVYVRQNFQPLFSASVVISNPEVPLGTHVFTAMEPKNDSGAMRWTVITVPDRQTTRDESQNKQLGLLASEVLDRIQLPQDAADKISELLTPGSSLVVSDYGLGAETGPGTDFVVVTR